MAHDGGSVVGGGAQGAEGATPGGLGANFSYPRATTSRTDGVSRTASLNGHGYVSSARCDSDILSMGGGGVGGAYAQYPTAPSSAATRTTDRTTSAHTRSQGSSSRGGHTVPSGSGSTSKKAKKLSFGRRSLAPSTWSGKKSIEVEKYTFYREPTPPPEGGTIVEEKPFGAGTALGASSYDYRYDHVAPPAPLPKSDRKCGLKRRTFWILLAVVLLLVAVAVGVGAGVGASQGKSSSGDSAESSEERKTTSSSSSEPSSTSATSKTPSETTSSEPSRTTTTSRASCPAANNTEYSVPGSDKSFLRICGQDFSGQFGGDAKAVDLGHVWTKSMEDCMINCAGYPGCTGAGWGVIAGDEGDDHRCWLKTKLMDSNTARAGWEFAILQ